MVDWLNARRLLPSSRIRSLALYSPPVRMCPPLNRQDAFTLDVLEVPQGFGSGFVWDKDGHIVTIFHVIRGASDLRYEKKQWVNKWRKSLHISCQKYEKLIGGKMCICLTSLQPKKIFLAPTMSPLGTVMMNLR